MKKRKVTETVADKKEDKKEGGFIDYLSKHLKIGGRHIGGQGRAKDVESAVDEAVNPKSEKSMMDDTETALKGLRKQRTSRKRA
jgi:hypothetical protein